MAPHRGLRTACGVLSGLGMMYIKRVLSAAIILGALGAEVGSQAFADPPCKPGILSFGTSVCLPGLFPKTPKTPTIDAPILLKPDVPIRPKPWVGPILPPYSVHGPNLPRGPILPRYPMRGPILPRYPMRGPILQANDKQQKGGDEQPKGKKKSKPSHRQQPSRAKQDQHQRGEGRYDREMKRAQEQRDKVKQKNAAKNKQRGNQR